MKKLNSLTLALLATVILGTGIVWADSPTRTATGTLDFSRPSLTPATGPNAEPGRIVYLVGTNGSVLDFTNFEPGTCIPFPSAPQICPIFVNSTPDAPGEFQRAHQGATAFTICNPCMLDGRTGSFVLKITYPNPSNLTVTKFTIQDARGGLEGLQGQGTLDFTNAQFTMTYRFARG